jgi:hypothetical protein
LKSPSAHFVTFLAHQALNPDMEEMLSQLAADWLFDLTQPPVKGFLTDQHTTA